MDLGSVDDVYGIFQVGYGGGCTAVGGSGARAAMWAVPAPQRARPLCRRPRSPSPVPQDRIDAVDNAAPAAVVHAAKHGKGGREKEAEEAREKERERERAAAAAAKAQLIAQVGLRPGHESELRGALYWPNAPPRHPLWLCQGNTNLKLHDDEDEKRKPGGPTPLVPAPVPTTTPAPAVVVAKPGGSGAAAAPALVPATSGVPLAVPAIAAPSAAASGRAAPATPVKEPEAGALAAAERDGLDRSTPMHFEAGLAQPCRKRRVRQPGSCPTPLLASAVTPRTAAPAESSLASPLPAAPVDAASPPARGPAPVGPAPPPGLAPGARTPPAAGPSAANGAGPSEPPPGGVPRWLAAAAAPGPAVTAAAGPSTGTASVPAALQPAVPHEVLDPGRGPAADGPAPVASGSVGWGMLVWRRARGGGGAVPRWRPPCTAMC